MANFINALDYNFVANNMASGMSNSREFARMAADAVSRNLPAEFPAGVYNFSDELVIPNALDVRGAGNSLTMFVFGGPRNGKYSGSLGFLMGFMNYDLSDKHFINGSGILDNSVNAASMWGFNLAGDSLISSLWGPLTLGNNDWYENTNQLNIDIKINIDPATTRATIFSIGSDHDNLTPFQLVYNQGKASFNLMTSDCVYHRFQYPCSTGDNEISIYMDTELGVIQFYNNGKLVAPTQASIAYAGNHPGRKLMNNRDDNPFLIGSEGVYGNVIYFSDTPSFTVWGLKISNAAKYTDQSGIQNRVDGAPMSHFNKYYRIESDTLSLMSMNRSPADIRSNRILYVDSGIQNGDWARRSVSTSALIVDKRHLSDYSFMGNHNISDICFKGYSQYGSPFTIFKATNIKTDNCAFAQGSRGKGRYPGGTSYSHVFKDSVYYGSVHYCFDLQFTMAHFENCYGDGAARANFRSRDGLISFGGKSFFTNTGSEYSIVGDGALIANGVLAIDGESFSIPCKGTVHWGTSRITKRGVFQMQYFATPLTPSGIPFMELTHYGGPTNTDNFGTSVEFGFLDMNINPARNPLGCVFKVNHPIWNNIAIKSSNSPDNKFGAPYIMNNYVVDSGGKINAFSKAHA